MENLSVFGAKGCERNDALLEQVWYHEKKLCEPSDLGRTYTFANVHLAKETEYNPNDYSIFTYLELAVPTIYENNGCIAGAWRCKPEDTDTDIDSITLVVYESVEDIINVAGVTSTETPPGYSEDVTYADIRYGGSEYLVNFYADIQPITNVQPERACSPNQLLQN